MKEPVHSIYGDAEMQTFILEALLTKDLRAITEIKSALSLSGAAPRPDPEKST